MKKLLALLGSLILLSTAYAGIRTDQIILNGVPITGTTNSLVAADISDFGEAVSNLFSEVIYDDIYADGQSQMFANQPTNYIQTNAVLSRTHTVAGFSKDIWQLFGANVINLPDNFTSNINVKATYYPQSSTNKTVAFFFYYSTDSAEYTLTNEVTIPACSITNQASWSFSTNLANAVAGQKIYWSAGIADTNSSGTTRDGLIYVEVFSCEFLTQ